MSILLQLIAHPSEFLPALRLKWRARAVVPATASPSYRFAADMLVKTSRSFAMVIQELGPELRDAVAIFYLTLRALDTIEDDTTYPADKRKEQLLNFYNHLEEPGWTFSECGVAHEKELLEGFDKIINIYGTLQPEYQAVIKDITKLMGAGMAEFLSTQRVDTSADWDQYCHYVAGLVGYGLSRLFAACGKEDPSFRSDYMLKLSNSMGLFLQKTNIIRDYLEDVIAGRIFWPRDVWSLYATNLEDLQHVHNSQAAVSCLNHLITDALCHIPDCLTYMSKIADPRNFNFCAIPQVMAIATLAECYANPKVFTGVVKIRRGTSAKLVSQCVDMPNLFWWFSHYLNVIESKVPLSDPNRARTLSIIENARKGIPPRYRASRASGLTTWLGVMALVATLSGGYVYWSTAQRRALVHQRP